MNITEFNKLQTEFTTMLQNFINSTDRFKATPMMMNPENDDTMLGIIVDGRIGFRLNVEKVTKHSLQPQD
jgi:hypothetical protein